MRRRCLLRRGRHRSPSPWALWDIWVVARRIVTVIPRALWRRCYRQLGGWRYDDWRVGIRVGIGIAIRSPVGSPERPNPDPDGDPWTAKPMEASVKTSVEASVEASKPPSSPRIARPGAGHKQRRQHHDDSHPRRPLARCLVLGIHGDHLPVSRCVSPVSGHIPRPGERDERDVGRVDHHFQPVAQGASPDVVSQGPDNFPDVATPVPLYVHSEVGRQTKSLHKPTVCPSVASRNLLLYQSLPISIPYRHAILWRRKDDPGVGTTASGTVE